MRVVARSNVAPVQPADSESTCHVPSRSRSDRLAFHKQSRAAPGHTMLGPMPFGVGVSQFVVDPAGNYPARRALPEPCRLDRCVRVSMS
jgi:hypothetical protein